MENNQDSQKSSGVCEKIHHAFSFHPNNNNTKIRRVSHSQEDPRPRPAASLPLHNHVGKPADHVQTKHPNSPKVDKFLGADHQIPIKLDYSSPKVASEVEEKQRHVVKVVEPHVQKEAGKQPSQDINDTFSDYIKRAKMKIRTVSNAGGGKNIASQQDDIARDHHHDTKQRDTSNDQFSEYINRAKMKIRAVSNAGSGKKNASPQDDAHDDHDTKKKDTSSDHFSEFINRAKMKIRSVSNAGHGGGKNMSFKRE
jgi:ribosomal protein L12E/L44/L45/RPP1/RPP2